LGSDLTVFQSWLTSVSDLELLSFDTSIALDIILTISSPKTRVFCYEKGALVASMPGSTKSGLHGGPVSFFFISAMLFKAKLFLQLPTISVHRKFYT
jgi:hypothetical protein